MFSSNDPRARGVCMCGDTDGNWGLSMTEGELKATYVYLAVAAAAAAAAEADAREICMQAPGSGITRS